CPRTRPPALLAQLVALRLEHPHRRGRLGELLQPLAEVLAVLHDRLELTVQDPEHRGVLAAERPPARRTLSLGAELGDLVALLLHLVVLLEELRPPRRGVFLLPHPGCLLLLDCRLGRLHALGEAPCLRLRSLERRPHVRELRDPL